MYTKKQAHSLPNLVWKAWQEQKDPLAQEQLVEQFLPLVQKTAHRLKLNLPQTVELDDLISWGAVGLLDALKKFDHDRGLAFETYATQRIRGAMIDGMREADWVPRSARDKVKKLEEAYRTFEQQFLRPPSEEELRQYLAVSTKELQQMISHMSRAQMVSLDQPVHQEDDHQTLSAKLIDEQTPNQLQILEEEEEKRQLASYIDLLPEKEKLVLSMIYFEELNFSETAEVMGLSTGRISQLHSKAISRLRQQMKDIERE